MGTARIPKASSAIAHHLGLRRGGFATTGGWKSCLTRPLGDSVSGLGSVNIMFPLDPRTDQLDQYLRLNLIS